MTSSAVKLIELEQLTFSWDGKKTLLDIPFFALSPGEHVFLMGPSGSGKSTLLGLLNGVLAPTRGHVRLAGTDLVTLSASARDRYRVDHIGYIFQQFNLLPFLTIRENVELPCHFSQRRAARAIAQSGSVRNAAARLLEHLGLPSHLHERRANHFSIGQQQRVAAARALIGGPDVVIADEPTSALDQDNKSTFLRLLFDECRSAGSGLLFVSHDGTLRSDFDRCIALSDINQATRT